jgi:putative transposase
MLDLLLNLLASFRSGFRTRAELVLENLALRLQLATLRRSSPRPHLRLTDRAFWIALPQVWSGWADALVIVTPDTVVRWHRAGFRLF